ncbi:MAG: cytochrome c3 family protein [Chloroflexi bacterium]|nr:cytochrome c3 family protein [Chloroflexota bacterium]
MKTDGSSRRKWLWRLLPLGLIVLVAAAVFVSRQKALAAPAQPIAYSHRTHVEAGVQCLFCHTSALRSSVAGIPSVQKCMGCHTVIATDRPEIKKVSGYWERGEPIPWARVNTQPDFVYFSHQSHLGAGLNCETCHGDVGHMTVARPVVKMDMGWCLDCHLKQPEEKVGRLTDCLACHK